jgi:hypothetical protein
LGPLQHYLTRLMVIETKSMTTIARRLLYSADKRNLYPD